MSMDPVKRLISIAGVFLLLTLLYSVFSAFYTDVEVNQQFLLLQPNHQVLGIAPIQTAPLATSPSHGTFYLVSYQKGKVMYLENISMRVGLDISAHFSNTSTYRDGPSVGSLLASHGNITLYIPSEINPQTYPYVVFWSASPRQVFAYVNLTNMSQSN